MLICEPLLFCCWLHSRHVVYLSTLFFWLLLLFATYGRVTCITTTSHILWCTLLQPEVESKYEMIFGTKISDMVNGWWLHPPLIHLIFKHATPRLNWILVEFNAIFSLLVFESQFYILNKESEVNLHPWQTDLNTNFLLQRRKILNRIMNNDNEVVCKNNPCLHQVRLTSVRLIDSDSWVASHAC